MAKLKFIRSKYFLEEGEVEQLAQVPSGGNPSVKKSKTDDGAIGAPVKRYDGYDKVSGTARYTFDVQFPDMLHARTLRSPHPHAKIISINTSRAEVLPGVETIIHHGNVPEIPWYGNSLLFDPHLRYVGDEIAVVAAIDERTADEAIKLIEVEYEVLPFAVDVEKVLNDGAPVFHETGVLSYNPWIYERGSVEAGFKEAEVVVEETFRTQVAVHNPTEAHISVAKWDGDRLKVWDSTQGIYSVQERISEALRIPASSVQVLCPTMGGGFGSKLEGGKYTVMAAVLAQRTGHPVRLGMDRKEMNLAVGNRPNSVQKLRVGAKRDGTLTAMELIAFGTNGAYPGWAGCNFPLIGTYKCPNVKTDMRSVYTNLGRSRAFRAPGRPQGTFAMDSILDDLATKLEMDPLELRLKNYAEIDQYSNQPYTSKKLREAYVQGAKQFGWAEKWRPAGSDTGSIKRGVGLASQIWSGGGGPPAGVTVKLNVDGSADVIAGSQDIGGGTYTFLTQVVAEGLDIPVENIRVLLGDTAIGPKCVVSGGSLTAPSLSPAAWDAANQIREVLLEGAAAVWDVDKSRIAYSKGLYTVAEDETKRATLPEMIEAVGMGTIVRTGYRAKNVEGYTAQSFGVQFAEVEVDTRTGKIRVLKILAAHDIGRTLNRRLLENQFHGGIIQGLSFALIEERVVDEESGRVLSTNLHDYKLPTIKDMPDIEVLIVENSNDTKVNSMSVKGIGEPPIIPTAGAIANAVFNATGVRIRELPMTPDRVLMALLSEA